MTHRLRIQTDSSFEKKNQTDSEPETSQRNASREHHLLNELLPQLQGLEEFGAVGVVSHP